MLPLSGIRLLMCALTLMSLAGSAFAGDGEHTTGTVDEVRWVSVKGSETYRVFRFRDGREFIVPPKVAEPLIAGMHIRIELAADRSAITQPAINFRFRKAPVVSAVQIDYVEVETDAGE